MPPKDLIFGILAESAKGTNYSETQRNIRIKVSLPIYSLCQGSKKGSKIEKLTENTEKKLGMEEIDSSKSVRLLVKVQMLS